MNAMNELVAQCRSIEFKLNGETVSALAGETIIQAAKRHGVDIPHLCYKEGLRPDGNCRACVVEIKGERVLAPSCCRKPTNGMEVSSDPERAVHSQKMVLELLLSRRAASRSQARRQRARFSGAKSSASASRASRPRTQPATDASHPAMCGEPRRLHPVHALPARLPRGTGERRDRLRLARRAREDRVRLRRSHGRVHLRRLRRMRAGLPHRRARPARSPRYR